MLYARTATMTGRLRNDCWRFVADRMLGKLADYLLMLGYDTVYFNGDDMSQLVDLAREEERVILSRNTRLERFAHQHRFLFVNDDLPVDQLRQVVRHLGLELDEKRYFTRCLKCNQRLVKTEPEAVVHKVPPYILSTQRDFAVCPTCKRVYWKGTHQRRMEEMIKRIFD